ncbi:5' nucleotidase, NT5C type [Actinocrispum wychmicini]|uniref:5'(3')-deoxyribonucleotidase n=1 Tax=Actinocrispum wychmicini TaxID=1213861 RepID=A0A4R2JKY9_9PSEU|nr:5'-nucleotidase [Actinocrispum wychmicini]TCO59222.1 5'(3')-deoxyribonucleotidase [Actinocrispum wychmicini]
MKDDFVFGVDLDGVCADFYGRMREVMAEWRGVDISTLTEEVSYELPEWGLLPNEYTRLHRFAVTQRSLFLSSNPIAGAAQSIRRLGTEGVRIRIITHRLFIRYFHKAAVAQTVDWLDQHGIPYWDLCFMRDKALVEADIYIEDTPSNIETLQARGKAVIAFTNSTNKHMDPAPIRRVDDWNQAEETVRHQYYTWLRERGRPLPPAPGHQPPDAEEPPDFASPRAG